MSIKKMIGYREIWMGFAMLWIMFFHSGIESHNNIITYIRSAGYGGVDIFLLASGIGNYYSYFRDEDPLAFFKRRIVRLAPVYIPFIIIWCSYKIMVGELSLIYVAGNVLGIQAFSNVGLSFNWYLSALIICYLLTPYFALFVKRNSIKKSICLILVLLLGSSAFWSDYKFIITATRLPIYYIGMIFAKYDSYTIRKRDMVVFGLGALFGIVVLFVGFSKFDQYLWPYGVYWYPFIFIAPFIVAVVSTIVNMTEKIKIFAMLYKGIFIIGKCSFELYLVHLLVVELMQRLYNNQILNIVLNNYMRCLFLIMAFAIGILLHYLSNIIIRLINGLKRGERL